MKLSEAYPSKYLSADDLQGRPVTVTIASVKVETLGQGQDADRKPVVSFVGKAKAFVCNKTNFKTIAKLYGDETDDWPGKSITLAPREVEFQGEMVWSIRVSLQAPGAGPIIAGKPAATVKNENLDEDVPF